LDDRRDDLLSRESAPLQVAVYPAPDFRQGLAEDDHLFVLVFVAHLAPTIMIAILFAAAIIASGRLNVAIR
jgi:hypothetical protein